MQDKIDKKQKTIFIPVLWDGVIQSQHQGSVSSYILSSVKEKLERDGFVKVKSPAHSEFKQEMEGEIKLSDIILGEYSKLSMVASELLNKAKAHPPKKGEVLTIEMLEELIAKSSTRVREAMIKSEFEDLDHA